MATAAAAAAAAAATTAAISFLLPSRCLVATTFKASTLHPLIPNFNLSSPITIPIRALSPLLPLRIRSRSFVSAAAAAYAESDDRGGDAEEDEASVPPDEAGRLYVGNLPYSMTSSQLAELFSEAGQVISVDLVYDRVTDRSRGFAFVSMDCHDDALNAIRMFDGSEVGGRTMKVNFPEVPRGGEREVMTSPMRAASRGYIDSPHKVYAGNLGWAVTGQSLRDAFASQPGILGAKVIYDRDSGRSRGFGFVSFATAEEAQAAIDQMNAVEVEGRPLRLSHAQRKPPPTPGPEVAASQSVDEELMEVH